MPYNFKEESRTYRTVFYLLIIFATCILGYVLYTVAIFSAVSFNNGPDIKLNRNERNLIKAIEKDCSCDVNFKHNYDLIINPDGRKYTYTDSAVTIGLSFNNSVFKSNKVLEDLCQRDSSFLSSYSISIARKLISTMDYMDYYQYIKLVYISNQQTSCYKIIGLKREQDGSLTIVRSR